MKVQNSCQKKNKKFMKIKFKSIFENEQKKTFDKIDPWDKNLCL
jgi:hypothetical protein